MTTADNSTPSQQPDRAAIQRIVDAAEAGEVEFVHIQFTDIPGTIKGLTVPISRLKRSLTDGVWFDGSSVEGLARIAENDLYLRPDPTTFAILPWERPRTARLLADLVTPTGQPFVADPRYVLKRAVAEAKERGFSFRVSAEVEFYLLEDPAAIRSAASPKLIPSDTRSYFELPGARAARVSQRAVLALRDFGYNVSSTHHEVSAGQHEIDLAADDPVRIADAIGALKLIVRTLASHDGLLATFMPKPLENASGSGIHLTQMLLDAQTGADLLFRTDQEHTLSPIAEHFIAGQLAHARGMCAILAPLVNSYKRLIGSDEAPATVSWARISPNALIRVPETAAPTGGIEIRVPDPSCNPYLSLAVLFQTGLAGIETETALPTPREQSDTMSASMPGADADPLPVTLGEALEELEWDMVVRSALSQPVFERFVAEKEREWASYRHHISDWELDNYLERA